MTEKTRLNITLSFPSAFSLRSYFVEKSPVEEASLHPDLDEQFVVGFDRASKILKREIPMAEVEREMQLDSFWLMGARHDHECNQVKEEEEEDEEGEEMSEDSCLVILKRSGVLNWGVRRKIRHFGRLREEVSSSGAVPNEKETPEREIPRKRGRKEEKNYKKLKLEKGRLIDRKGAKTPKDRWSPER